MNSKLPIIDLQIDDLMSRLDDDCDWLEEREKLKSSIDLGRLFTDNGHLN